MLKNEKKILRKKKQLTSKKSSFSLNPFIIGGIVCILIGLSLFASIFHSSVVQEANYFLHPGSNNTLVLSKKDKSKNMLETTIKKAYMTPVDEEYGIVIPKIGANSRVIADVSPYNEKEYQVQLTKGVAHARDTAYPGQFGNTFIFAHSASNWYQANQYNAVFYLLNKLTKGDDIYLFYKGTKYKYTVTEHKIVDSNAFEYLKQDHSAKKLTLMTCWPAGTTLKRYIVEASLITP